MAKYAIRTTRQGFTKPIIVEGDFSPEEALRQIPIDWTGGECLLEMRMVEE